MQEKGRADSAAEVQEDFSVINGACLAELPGSDPLAQTRVVTQVYRLYGCTRYQSVSYWMFRIVTNVQHHDSSWCQDYGKWYIARLRLLDNTLADGREFLCQESQMSHMVTLCLVFELEILC